VFPTETELRLKAKLERAERHIYDLDERWDIFRKEAYRVEFRNDESTGARTYYLAQALDPDIEFSTIIGDAVHNLRSSLDHLAYHVMSISPGITDKDLKRTHFPIAEDVNKYQTEQRGQIERMRQDAIKTIDDIEPYGGGAGQILWHLHSLDIIDKHKLLIAVGSTNSSQSSAPQRIALNKQRFLGIGLDAYTPAQDAVLFTTECTNPIFPLETGDILAVVPKSEVNEHMQFTFEIAFGEPEVIRGKPVIVTLHQMAERILYIVKTFLYSGMAG
jgi:hypothetical protein